MTGLCARNPQIPIAFTLPIGTRCSTYAQVACITRMRHSCLWIARRSIKGEQRWSTGRGSFVSAVGIDTTLLLATLRVVARVRLEDGFVWSCRAPQGVDDGTDDAALITLHQVRLPDVT